MIAADTTISSVKKNPALAYLSRLGSSRSVITISNCLKHIANILGAKDIEFLSDQLLVVPIFCSNHLQQLENELLDCFGTFC